MSFKKPRTIFGRTLYRIVIVLCLLLGPLVLLGAALIDYIRLSLLSDLGGLYSKDAWRAFKRGGAV